MRTRRSSVLFSRRAWSDRARGQIDDDRPDRINGRRPFVQQGFQHAEIREAKSSVLNPAAMAIVKQGRGTGHSSLYAWISR
jgi:hypothetical protein